MKIASILVLVFAFAAAGCGDKTRKNETGAGPATPLKHAVNECPQIAGDFSKDSTNQKSFRVTPIENGIIFTDSETEFTIDGTSYIPRGNNELTYVGGCEAMAIVIDVYEGTVYLGRYKYSLLNADQLSLQTTAHDSRLGKDGNEIWHAQPKKKD